MSGGWRVESGAGPNESGCCCLLSTYHSGYRRVLGASHWRYVGYYVAVHGNQKLLFAALGALFQIVLPEFVLADARQNPLVFSASHLFAVGLAEQQ